MDASTVSSNASATVQGTAALIMMKKSMDIQAQSALSLLDAVPAAPKYNNPAGLGSSVDTRA
ncbi:MAG: YjfB family protein [Proteobacteria bacterium]|nr:YjfB family protein [Pseudomonadota bacterium]